MCRNAVFSDLPKIPRVERVGDVRHVTAHNPQRLDVSSMASLTAPAPLCLARGRFSGARPGPAPRRAAPYRVVRADASASSTPRLPETIAEALDTVEAHLALRGADLYAATPEVTAAVRTMVASKRTDGKTVSEVLDASDGVWEVFDMPHMRKLSAPARVGFKPVRYTLKNRKLRSDVRFKVPSDFNATGSETTGFGGWLSAAGGVKVSAKRDDAVEVFFSSFWVGRDGDAPRDPPRASLRSPEERLLAGDALIDAVGNAGFVSSFAQFPLHFFDERRGLCVFEFPPMSSFVACKRVAAAPDATAF